MFLFKFIDSFKNLELFVALPLCRYVDVNNNNA